MSQRTIKLTMKQTHGIKVDGSIDIEDIEGVSNVGHVNSIEETYSLLIIHATLQTKDSSTGFVTARLSNRAVYEAVEEALNSNLKYSMKNLNFKPISDSVSLKSIYGYRGNIIPDGKESESHLFRIYVREINKDVYSIELMIHGWKSPLFVRAITCNNIIDGIRSFLKLYLTDKHIKDYYKTTRKFWKELQDGVIPYPGENLVSLIPQETENLVEKMVESLD